MKNAAIQIITVLAVMGCGTGIRPAEGVRAMAAEPQAEPVEAAKEQPRVTRDARGNPRVTLDEELRAAIELRVAKPAAEQLAPEVKGYGRVLDPAPLAALAMELSAARAACEVSSNELVRLKTLETQGNASLRALQTAEVAAQRDCLALRSAGDRLMLSWGGAVAGRTNLAAFVQSAVSQQTALVRIDLPAGQKAQQPIGGRIVALSGAVFETQLLGPAPTADPQVQGKGYLLCASTPASGLVPGEPVTGWLKLKGEPLSGVIVPRDAVVRAEGAGWVYLQKENEPGTFTRIEIALDHPTEAGWFVSRGVSANDLVVVAGAQMLLSTERAGGEE